jgi:hypothetical protein
MQKLALSRFALPTIIILALVTLAILAVALLTHNVHVHVPGTAFDWPCC